MSLQPPLAQDRMRALRTILVEPLIVLALIAPALYLIITGMQERDAGAIAKAERHAAKAASLFTVLIAEDERCVVYPGATLAACTPTAHMPVSQLILLMNANQLGAVSCVVRAHPCAEEQDISRLAATCAQLGVAYSVTDSMGQTEYDVLEEMVAQAR
jgi:hypothetical protein